MNIYIMSNLHGNFIDFLRMLHFIDFKDSDMLYILGDIFNCNGSGLDIYEYIKNKKNIILIKGNHEYFIEKALKVPLLFMYQQNKTKIFYKEIKKKDKEYKKELSKYLKELPLCIKINDYILVHKNIYLNKKIKNANIEEILKKQTNFKCFILSNNIQIQNNYKYIVGHIPVQNINNSIYDVKILFKNNYIYMDCYTGCKEYNGVLSCLELNSFKEYYIN